MPPFSSTPLSRNRITICGKKHSGVDYGIPSVQEMGETDSHYVLKMKKELGPSMGETVCRALFGTSLGFVYSKKENDDIQIFNMHAWMGLYRDSRGKWNWGDETGTDIMDPKNCLYSNWRSDESNTQEMCAGISYEGTWGGCYVYLSLLSYSSHRVLLLASFSVGCEREDTWKGIICNRDSPRSVASTCMKNSF